MLEFCQTVNPSLEDYEADGVRSSVHFLVKMPSTNLMSAPGLADTFGRLCIMEKDQNKW